MVCVATVHSFQTGPPVYRELENRHFVGNGRFVVEGGEITVESRVGVGGASTGMD